jgi:hypothetical protein
MYIQNTRVAKVLKTREIRILSVWIAATQRCVGCEGKKRESDFNYYFPSALLNFRDPHLRNLKHFHGVRIIDVKAFVERGGRDSLRHCVYLFTCSFS